MTPITCSIIKQYMWYHKKYKKLYDGNNLTVLFFKSTSVFYVIYENLDQENLVCEKTKYNTTPTEHVINGNVYHTFSFYKINEDTVINKLRDMYNIFFIDIEQNKTWTERSEHLKKNNKPSLFSNIFTFLSNVLYESIEFSTPDDIDIDIITPLEKPNLNTSVKIPSFDNMILCEMVNKHNPSSRSLFEELDTSITSSNVILEDEFAVIKGETELDSDDLINTIDDELVEIKRNPLDRTYTNIGTGKKLKFSKKNT